MGFIKSIKESISKYLEMGEEIGRKMFEAKEKKKEDDEDG